MYSKCISSLLRHTVKNVAQKVPWVSVPCVPPQVTPQRPSSWCTRAVSLHYPQDENGLWLFHLNSTHRLPSIYSPVGLIPSELYSESVLSSRYHTLNNIFPSKLQIQLNAKEFDHQAQWPGFHPQHNNKTTNTDSRNMSFIKRKGL